MTSRLGAFWWANIMRVRRCLLMAMFLLVCVGGGAEQVCQPAEKLRQYEQWNGYYQRVNDQVLSLLQKNKYDEAYDVIQKERALAFSRANHMGIAYSMMFLAEYHNFFDENSKLTRLLQEAIGYAQKHQLRQQVTMIRERLARAFLKMDEYDKVVSVCDETLRDLSDTPSKASFEKVFLSDKIYALFMLHRDEACRKTYQQLSATGVRKNVGKSSMEKYADIISVYLGDNRTKAIMMLKAPELQKYDDTFDLQAECFRRMGDWKNLSVILDTLMERKASRALASLNQRMIEVNDKYDVEKLEAEHHQTEMRNSQLALANNRLLLNNAELELNRVKAAQQLTQLDAANLQLTGKKHQLESQKLRDSIAAVKAIQMEMKKDAEEDRQRGIIIIGIILMFFFCLVFAFVYRTRMIRRLHAINDSLAGVNSQLASTHQHLQDNNATLLEAKKKAEEADQMKTRFIQNMSHEVRTPLNAVVGFSQLLSEMGDQLAPEERQEMSRSIRENSTLLTTLISDILDLTNIESGRYQMLQETVSPNELCRKALKEIEGRMPVDVKLLFHTDAPDDFTIVSDGKRTIQVLTNMLTNAEKNTTKGSITLRCSLQEEKGFVTFSVTDTGVGVPEDKMDAIFERFTKLDTFKQGAGLGLNICTTIAQRLGGKLFIDRKHRPGARFVFALKRTAVMLLLLLTGLAAVQAQTKNNRIGIDDRLYPMYQRANKYYLSKEGLLTADSLYQEAVRLGDEKAQCLALSFRYLYAFSNAETVEEFDKEFVPYAELAWKYKMWNYYYTGVTNRVAFLVNIGEMDKAADYVASQYALAQKKKDPIGIMNSYTQMAMIQRNCYEDLLAIRTQKKALDYALSHHITIDLFNLYWRVAWSCGYACDFKKQLYYAEEGLKNPPMQKSLSLSLLQEKAIALYMLHREKEFAELYREIKQLEGNSGRRKPVSQIYVESIDMALSGKIDEACENLRKKREGNLFTAWEISIEILRRNGDWKRLSELQTEYLRRKYNFNRTIEDERLMGMEAKYQSQQVLNNKRESESKSLLLKLNHSRLTLENSNLEISQARAAQRLTGLHVANLRLSNENDLIKAAQLRDSVSIQSRQQNIYKEQSFRKRVFFLVVLGISLLIITVLLTLYIKKRKMSQRINLANKKLEDANRELEEANRLIAESNEKVLEEKNKTEQSERMKTFFVQNMSHEVRTPLNAVVGFSQLLTDMGDELTPEERADINKRICDNSSLLTTLINDILDLTSIETEHYHMKSETVEVNALCRTVLLTVEHRLPKGVKLEFESQLPDGFTLTSDANRIAQVLINLLTNAEKNTIEGFIRLNCSLTENPGFMTFSVSDSGVGIPEDKMDAIFQRFTKLDNFKSGSGLGLNICTLIVNKLHGELSIDRHYHPGARFFFTIPTDQTLP